MGNSTCSFVIARRDGWGQGKLEKFFLFFGELPFLTVTPEFYNLHEQAINFVSMYRWDAQKRKVAAEISGPFRRKSEISIWVELGPAKRELGHKEIIPGPGTIFGKPEYAARSDGR